MVALATLVETTTNFSHPDGAMRARSSSRPPAFDEAAKDQVYGQWRRGVSVQVLSQRYRRSRAAIDQAINEMRARRILEQKLEYMYDASFDEPGAAEAILARAPDGGSVGRAKGAVASPAGMPAYLASLYDSRLLSPAEETHLFRRMNYLKYLASKIRQSLVPAHALAADLDEIERLQGEALDIKNELIRANLRLVVSIARKHVAPSNEIFELISDGNMSLIRAVEKFDFARGFRFSTYASWAIMKNFARALADQRSRRDRFVTGRDELLEDAADHRTSEHEWESDYRRDRNIVHEMLGKLDDRERRILVSRYGIGGASELTLAQLGKELGITKERVRQLESRAQQKLRKFAGK